MDKRFLLSADKPNIIICTTSDIATDRRMQRIADTLIQDGYKMLWIGRNPKAQSLDQKFKPSIIKCFFKSGPFFYAEFNFRLCLRLISLAKKSSIINAVDLDTILAVKLASAFKSSTMVFDAHEYFEEVPELNNKKLTKSIWRWIAKISIKKSKWNYTVNHSLANIFSRSYGQPFEVIRNTPPTHQGQNSSRTNEKILGYVGVLNKGRGCLLYTSPSPRDQRGSRMPSSA